MYNKTNAPHVVRAIELHSHKDLHKELGKQKTLMKKEKVNAVF